MEDLLQLHTQGCNSDLSNMDAQQNQPMPKTSGKLVLIQLILQFLRVPGYCLDLQILPRGLTTAEGMVLSVPSNTHGEPLLIITQFLLVTLPRIPS